DSNQPAVALRFGSVNESMTLGVDFAGGDEYFGGTIRDARVYGRALTGAEITALASVNHAPVFGAASNATIVAGQTLVCTTSATDPEAPRQPLWYSLLNGPAGAAVNQTNGNFTWRPAISQSPSTNGVMLVVTDNGPPALSTTQNFQVTVL